MRQTKESIKLVETFKKCVEQIKNEKQQNRNINIPAPEKGIYRPSVGVDDLNSHEKRKVLEAFVENDDALGLLLDFISSKHMHPNAVSGVGLTS